MVKHLGDTLLALLLTLAGMTLVVSCASSPPPDGPVATVSAASPVTSATLEASPAPATVETPHKTATPAATATEKVPPVATIPVCTVRIVGVFPHDRAAYTQGLVFEDGGFYEGTGLKGESTLRRVALESGEVLQSHSLPSWYFGEGITTWEDRIIQLTWKSGWGFVYDRESFELLDTFDYPTEGWGITHDGAELIMSDGTPTLHFWDPDTFVETGSIEVYDDAGPVTWLNELEYIQGTVYANVWKTERIAVIDPQTGQVTAWIDLRGLLEPEDLIQPVDVLNGIAYDAGSERLFVTGKLWPKLFEIELISPTGAPAPLTCR
jgi:glutamine cyclotransferase